MAQKPRGWPNEPARHSLAAHGIETARKEKTLESQASGVANAISFGARTGNSPVIYRSNVRGLATEDELNVPSSELAIHVGAAGKPILAYTVKGNGADVLYWDGETARSLNGLADEVLDHKLIRFWDSLFDRQSKNTGPMEVRK